MLCFRMEGRGWGFDGRFFLRPAFSEWAFTGGVFFSCLPLFRRGFYMHTVLLSPHARHRRLNMGGSTFGRRANMGCAHANAWIWVDGGDRYGLYFGTWDIPGIAW